MIIKEKKQPANMQAVSGGVLDCWAKDNFAANAGKPKKQSYLALRQTTKILTVLQGLLKTPTP